MKFSKLFNLKCSNNYGHDCSFSCLIPVQHTYLTEKKRVLQPVSGVQWIMWAEKRKIDFPNEFSVK